MGPLLVWLQGLLIREFLLLLISQFIGQDGFDLSYSSHFTVAGINLN